MARRQATSSRSSSRPRRPVEWSRVATVPTILIGVGGGVSAAVFDLTPTVMATLVSPTIVRIRGRIDISADVTAPMGRYAAGLVKISRKSLAGGIAAIPIPLSDDADWQWYDAGCLGDSVTFSSPTPEEDVLHLMVDTKAMRRYEQDDETLAFVFANNSGVTGDDLFFCANFSILIKE